MNHALPFITDDVRSAIAFGLRVVVGVVWLVAAIAKARGPVATRDGVRRLLGGAPVVVAVIAGALPIVEAVLGVLMLAGVQVRLVAAISAGLFILFAVLILSVGVRHSVAAGGCGCFGVRPQGQDHDGRAAALGVARNFVLAAMAIATASQA